MCGCETPTATPEEAVEAARKNLIPPAYQISGDTKDWFDIFDVRVGEYRRAVERAAAAKIRAPYRHLEDQGPTAHSIWAIIDGAAALIDPDDAEAP